MSTLKDKAIQAVKETATEAVQNFVSEKLDPEKIKAETDRLASGGEHVPTHEESVREALAHPQAKADQRVVAALGEMADLEKMGDEEKAKLVWEETRDTIGWKEGKFWGLADTIGGWITEKVIGMGLLPKSFVIAAAGKKKLREEMKRRKSGLGASNKDTGNNARDDAGAAGEEGKKRSLLQGFKEGVEAGKEKGKEIVETVEATFESSKKAVLNTLDQWQRFAARLHLTGTVREIATCSKKVGELAYTKLSQGARAAMESFKTTGDPASDLREFFIMLREELGELPEDVAELMHEMKLSRISEPREKAKKLSEHALATLRKRLFRKPKEHQGNVTEEKLTKEFDPLVARVLSVPYDDKQSDEAWQAVFSYVNGLGTSMELRETNGIYHALDYGSDHWTDMPLGFTSDVTGERILGIPALYFNSTGVIESFSANVEEIDRFFSSFSDALGNQAPKSKAALEKLRAKWKNGEVGMKDILFKTDDTMAELAEAVKEEVGAGTLALAGVEGGAVAIGGAGWYVFKTSWGTLGNTVWDGLIKTFAHNTNQGMREALRSGLKAAGAEYVAGSSRLVAYVMGPTIAKRFMEKMDDPWTLGMLLGASVTAGLTTLGMPLYVGYKTLTKGHDIVNWIEDTKEALQKKQFNSYYARRTQRMANRRYFGSEKIHALFAGEANLSHMIRMDKELREIVTIKHVTNVGTVATESRNVSDYTRATKGKLGKAEKNLERWMETYLLQNYDGGWINRLIMRRVDNDLLKRVQEELTEQVYDVYAKTGRFPGFEELQIVVDRTVIKRIPGVRKVWDASRQIEKLEAIIKNEKDAVKKAEWQNMLDEVRVYHAANFHRLGEIATHTGDIDRELKAVTSANTAARRQTIEGLITKLRSVEDKIVTEAVSAMQKVATAPRIMTSTVFNEALKQAIEHEGFVMEQFLRDRMELIKKLRDTPRMDDLAKKLAQETDDLIDVFRKEKVDAFVKLGKEYSEVYKAANAAEQKVLKSNFQRFFKGATGGGKILGYVTRPIRTSVGRLKFGAMLAGATLLYKYYIAPQSTDEQNKFEVFAFIEKEGAEVIDLILAVAAPLGSYDWYRLWEGKDFHGNALTTGGYVTHTLFGIAGLAGDITAFVSFGGTAAAVRGVRIGTKVATKGTRMASLSVRAFELVQKVGGITKMKDIIAAYRQYKAMGKTGLATLQPMRGVSHAGYVLGTVNVAGQLVAGTMRTPDEPVYGIAANEQEMDYAAWGNEAKEAIDEALGPEPVPKETTQGEQRSFNPQSA